MYNISYVSKRNKEQTIREVNNDYKCEKKLCISGYENAIVASRRFGGPGAFSQAGYIRESDFTLGSNEKRQLKQSNIPFFDEEVVFIGTLTDVYGHCITDNLKHLWILLEDSDYKNKKFVYVTFKAEESIGNIFFTICKTLGKPREEIEEIQDIRRYRRVYIPDQCFFCKPGGKLEQSGERYFTPEYKRIIDRLKEEIPIIEGYDKVYFTRTALNSRYRDFGEHFIEKTFNDLGFKIVSPEKIGFIEQISILKSCNAFATTQGSISLNAVFCNHDATVILVNKQNYNTPYQLAINQVRGGNCIIIDANKSVLNPRRMPWVGPFFMYNSKELCEFASIKYKGIPKFEFARYLLFGSMKRVKGFINHFGR